MKRLSFFALTSLVLAGTCFDVQAGEQLLQQNRDIQQAVFKKIVERCTKIKIEKNIRISSITNITEEDKAIFRNDSEIRYFLDIQKVLRENEKVLLNPQTAIVPYVAPVQEQTNNSDEVDAKNFLDGSNLPLIDYINNQRKVISTSSQRLPFLKRHEIAIKRIGAVLGGVATVAAVAYTVKHPQEAKQKLQAAGNKAIEVGGKVVGVVAQGADKLANVAGSALNAAKDRMPSASTVVNAVRNRMPSSSSLPSLSSLNPFKK